MLKNVAGGGTTNYIVLDGGEEKSIFYRPTRHRDNVTAAVVIVIENINPIKAVLKNMPPRTPGIPILKKFL